MSSKKPLFVMRQPPYGSNLAREALEAVLAAGSFEQTASVLFIDDGVLQLIDNQQAEKIACKNHSAMLQALPLYDVDKLYADSHSLTERSINNSDITPAVTVLNTDAVKKLMADHSPVLSF